MQARPYFDSDKVEIKANQHNIFVPICLGNKFFTQKNIPTENVKAYIDWAIGFTKEKVLILVVDDIQITNYLARNPRSTYNVNLRRLQRDGFEIRGNLEKVVSTFPEPTQKNIEVIQWKDYVREDPYVGSVTHLVYKEFKNNKKFSEEVLKTVKTSVTDRNFTEETYWLLCDYILDEFSLCYSGTRYRGINYNMFIYPNKDSASDFIERIKRGIIYKKLHDKLPCEKAEFAILS